MKEDEDIKSFTRCKLCDKDFITELQQCQYCNKYSIRINWFGKQQEEYEIESETISSGNFYLVFFPAFKEANVVSRDNKENKQMRRIEMEELTPEVAAYWVDRLKKYVLFQ